MMLYLPEKQHSGRRDWDWWLQMSTHLHYGQAEEDENKPGPSLEKNTDDCASTFNFSNCTVTVNYK